MSSSMHPRRRLLGRMVATSALALTGAKISTAQSPTGTMQVLCGAPAGSIPDIVARRFAEQLNGRSAASVIVDNRPGAAGQIAIGALKQAPIDGSSVLLATGAIASVYPYLYSKLAYDPALDLQPVSLAGEMNLGLAVGPAVPDAVTKVAELIDWLRRNPKLANIGSPGVGTLPHLLPALLFQQAKLDWQHIAYPGGPPALANLIGGQISALVLPEGLLRAHQLAGKLRILATSGAQRTAYLPDVASFAEQGFYQLVVREWFAFFLPGRTPPKIAEQLSQAVRAAASQPALAAAFGETGMTAVASTPAQLSARIVAEQRFWEPVIRSTGIRAE